MNIKDQRGVSDNVFIAGIFVFIILAWFGTSILGENPNKPSSSSNSNSFVSNNSTSGSDKDSGDLSGPINSPWYDKVSISRGNSSSEYRPYKEYITIRASSRNKEAINITGWILENGAGERLYQVGSNVQKGEASRFSIPYAALVYYSTGLNTLGPVMLQPGEKAILTTGSPLPVTPKPLTSFKVNKCSGYIEKWDNVNFTPSISASCPSPSSYPGVNNMEKSCRDFVRRLGRCETPEFKDIRTSDGGFDSGAVDGVLGLTNQCKAFIKNHFNYSSCVANHINDDDFYKKEWRLYLGSRWELWAKRDETISLYDAQGRLVQRKEY